MEWLAGAAAVLPPVALFILLLMAIRRQHRAIREVPGSFGEGLGGEDDVREPRRPLVPQGSVSAAEPLPEPAEVTHAIATGRLGRTGGQGEGGSAEGSDAT